MTRLIVVAVVGALVVGCSIEHKSGDYVCTKQSDCSGNRICLDGFCIDPTAPDASGPIDGRIDGPPDAKEPPQCPGMCTSCDPEAMTCTIDCSMTSCDGLVECPEEYDCTILCNVQNSCRNGVECTFSNSCDVQCSGNSSCRQVDCGFGPCSVTCSGTNSCRDIDCQAACACDVRCPGSQSCTDGVFCPLGCNFGAGCASFIPGCNVCP